MQNHFQYYPKVVVLILLITGSWLMADPPRQTVSTPADTQAENQQTSCSRPAANPTPYETIQRCERIPTMN
jgi:hypothetical protein